MAGPKKPEQGRAGCDTFPEPLDHLRNEGDVAHPVRYQLAPPPFSSRGSHDPKKTKRQEACLGRPTFWTKVGWEGWLWAAGCRRAGLGLGVQGAQAVVRHVTLYPGTLVTPVSPPRSSTRSGAQCQVAWTSRRWPEAGPLYRDRAPLVLQHVVTLPPAGLCSQPLTRTLEVRHCGLAGRGRGRPGQVRTHAPGAGVFGSCVGAGLGWLSGCLVRIPSFVSTARSYPHPPAVPQSVGKGSLPELRSHLLPSPPLVFLLPPTDPGSRFDLPLFPSSLAVSRARRTQPASASPGFCSVQLCPSAPACTSLQPFQ